MQIKISNHVSNILQGYLIFGRMSRPVSGGPHYSANNNNKLIRAKLKIRESANLLAFCLCQVNMSIMISESLRLSRSSLHTAARRGLITAPGPASWVGRFNLCKTARSVRPWGAVPVLFGWYQTLTPVDGSGDEGNHSRYEIYIPAIV